MNIIPRLTACLRSNLRLDQERNFSLTSKNNTNVLIAGAAGSVGRPLSLLLKLSEYISGIRLYDLKDTTEMANDLSAIETPPKITFFKADYKDQAFKDADVVICTAGNPRRNHSLMDLFESNALIVKSITEAVAKQCPKAMFCLVTEPINAMVPLACETLKNHGVFDPNRVFGVSTLNAVRSNTIFAKMRGLNPLDVQVPVVGGHYGHTIIPLVSQAIPKAQLPETEYMDFIKKVQEPEIQVLEEKASVNYPVLSTAYGTARFGLALVRALQGEQNVIESAYVLSTVTQSKYFMSPLLLGKNGIEKNLGLPRELNKVEEEMISKAVTQLASSISKGETFAKANL